MATGKGLKLKKDNDLAILKKILSPASKCI
jgi:hypothetical protein